MQQVEVRVKGHLDEHWTEWLYGLCFFHTEQNETILTGSVQDQAALYGLLTRLRDLGLVLISVKCEGLEKLADEH